MEAKAAGIPVILTDRAVTADPSLYAGFLGSDFVEEGRKAARWVVEQFKDRAQQVNIVQLEGTVGSAPANDRKKGFEEVIARHPNFRIVRVAVRGLRRAAGRGSDGRDPRIRKRARSTCSTRTTTTWRSAPSRPSKTRVSSPGKDILIVSIDAVRAAFEAMIAGKLNATVECNPLHGAAAHDVGDRSGRRAGPSPSASSWTKRCSRMDNAAPAHPDPQVLNHLLQA